MNRLIVLYGVLGLLARFDAASGWAAEANPSQAKAVAAMKELGGKVAVDQNSPDRPLVEVNLAGTQVTDAGLAQLKGLTELRWLNLWNTQVTDAGLDHLKGLNGLQLLNLGNTKVGDAGLKRLEGLTALDWLGLEQTGVTDAGVAGLQRALPNCQIEWQANLPPDYVVPRGNVSELAGYVKRLLKYRPRQPAQVVEYRGKFHLALQAAAERILELEKDQGSEAYRSARFLVLSNRVYWFARAVPSEQRRIIAAVKDYLDEKLDQGSAQEAVDLAERAAKTVQQTGQWDWAAETYESFAARVKSNKDGKVAARAGPMLESAKHLRGLNAGAPKSSPPAIEPQGTMTPVDLSEKANVGNTEWAGKKYHSNGLAELPKGDQEFCGVKFRTTQRQMQLGYGFEQATNVPASIEGIAVGRKLRRLYVLQATKYPKSAGVHDGKRIAEYRVHYGDGSEASVPVVFGRDVRDWWDQDEGKPVTQGRVAWTGSNPVADKTGKTLRFYLGVWENPHTERTIATLEFVKTEDPTCAPFCLAITAEE